MVFKKFGRPFPINKIKSCPLSIGLVLLTFLLACNLVAENIAPSNSEPELELYSNFHTMGIVIKLPANNNPGESTFTTLEYSAGADQYRDGFPLDRVDDTHFVGSLFWLEPDTTYHVRVTLNDPEGGPLDGHILTATGATRPEVVVPQPRQSYYVAPDATGEDCNLEAPCSLVDGLSGAQPGDEVILRGGVYYQGNLSLPQSGLPDSPIVIRGYEGENAILDGADPQEFSWEAQGNGIYYTAINVSNPSLVTADDQRLFPYKSLADLRNLIWGLPGFHASGKKLYVHLADDADPNLIPMAVSRFNSGFEVNVDYIAFLNLTFRHYGRATYAKAIFLNDASNNLIQETTFTMNNQGINIKGDSHRNLIQENEFSDSLFEWPWDAVKKGGAQFVEAGGVFVNLKTTGRGNVIRYNTFNDLFDGFHLCPDEGPLTNETDVYENIIYRMVDDGLETDGECSNIRIWSNTINDVLNGISMSPVYKGPVYAIFNVIYNFGTTTSEHDGSPFKFIYSLSSDGSVYLFHNTTGTENAGNDGIRTGGDLGNWESIIARNNIWAGTRYALANYNRGQALDFDFDALCTTAEDTLFRWKALSDGNLATLADFQRQTGQEMNGLYLCPIFMDVASGNFQLASNSPLIDAGVVIPGINDTGNHGYRGQGPDIGAYELK